MQKRWIVLAGAVGGVLLAAAVDARTLRTITAATVTNASATMVAASTGPRVFVAITNESATATIACNFGGTAVANTAGNYTLGPGTTRTWGPGTEEYPVPGGAINCISSAATSPATIETAP